jgi:hypothetical protein
MHGERFSRPKNPKTIPLETVEVLPHSEVFTQHYIHTALHGVAPDCVTGCRKKGTILGTVKSSSFLWVSRLFRNSIGSRDRDGTRLTIQYHSGHPGDDLFGVLLGPRLNVSEPKRGVVTGLSDDPALDDSPVSCGEGSKLFG